jgi:urease accessory protein
MRMPEPDPTAERSDERPDSGGWAASLELGFAPRNGRTALIMRCQRGPLAVQRPFYPEGSPCHVYLLHPPGGVVGGDWLDIGVRVAEGAHALITTPGATKYYRSSGPRARVRQRLRVDAGGVLEWLPQEGILFPGACVRVDTRFDLSGDARLVAWEVQTLGRPACGERFAEGVADLGLSLYRCGRPVLLERLRLGGGSDLIGQSGLRGYPICATLVACPAVSADLEAARAHALEAAQAADLPVLGITLVDGTLVVRCLGAAVEPVQRAFRGLWGLLRPRLLGMAACPPRIWAT